MLPQLSEQRGEANPYGAVEQRHQSVTRGSDATQLPEDFSKNLVCTCKAYKTSEKVVLNVGEKYMHLQQFGYFLVQRGKKFSAALVKSRENLCTVFHLFLHLLVKFVL